MIFGYLQSTGNSEFNLFSGLAILTVFFCYRRAYVIFVSQFSLGVLQM